ncbi:hypothetical protein [Streptomyces sp. SP18BB07]|nr:hypothetical protein [Streptomyces sp. SP18BB07]
MASIKDAAAEAGVSVATVSREEVAATPAGVHARDRVVVVLVGVRDGGT